MPDLSTLTESKRRVGLTETAAVVAATSADDILLGSCGSLLPGVEAKLICSENSLEIHEHNKPGELYVRSPSVTTMGYLDNPQSSAETFTDDGWLRTGDEAMIVKKTQGNGKLTEHLIIVDRIKELIKVKVS
jgi:long-subunit acyl-CoA synthetase (AMP-forming)